MLTLPLITPRDVSQPPSIIQHNTTQLNPCLQSHELWFGSSNSHRTSTPSYQNQPPSVLNNETHPRHNGGPNANNAAGTVGPNHLSTGENISTLQLEERALRARKNNIASFGYGWIKPAGCSKTMLGMKEEEAEREEALAAAAQEMAAAAAAAAAETGVEEGQEGEGGGEEEGMERDLDDDIPDAEAGEEADADDAEGLVEEGEEGLEEDGLVDEEGFMERDLDDDVPEAYPDDQEDSENALAEEVFDDAEYEAFDEQPDLDDEVPIAGDGAADEDEDEDDEGSDEGMVRDLDDDIPEAAEDVYNPEEEWQHTDTEAEFDDEEDDGDDHSLSFAPNNSLRNSTSSAPRTSLGLPPGPPSIRRDRRSRGLGGRETEAQRRFLQRWSGGGDAFADSSMLADEEDLGASTTSQGSRRSIFGRFARRNGGPRDSFD